MEVKIKKMLERYQELEEMLGSPDLLADPKKYKAVAQEHSHLSDLRQAAEELASVRRQIRETKAMIQEVDDPELREMAQLDNDQLVHRETVLLKKIEDLLIPPDPNDDRAVIFEIRAGTGGDEAALFVGDCVRMYKLYAQQKGWKVDTLSASESEMGGFKEYVMSISGKSVYKLLKFEAGTHRVQRVPKTEAQGRIHTSAVTMAVLMEPDEEEQVVIDERDLKIDTYRSSGAGGQHVNTTDSAVRITHIPTGTVVYCQEEKSQHKNKDKAMRLLGAKIAEEKRRKEEAERSAIRSSQVGTGDRSERIRTYNFPQNRITDHRIELTLYKLDRVMNGDLDDLVTPLVAYFHQQKLSS